MIKKALLILIFQIGYTFPSFALEVNPINIDTLAEDENHKLKISAILTAITKNFNADWYQEKIYQNNDISVGFFIVLHENGALKHLKMNYVHCGNDTNNECKHFILSSNPIHPDNQLPPVPTPSSHQIPSHPHETPHAMPVMGHRLL